MRKLTTLWSETGQSRRGDRHPPQLCPTARCHPVSPRSFVDEKRLAKLQKLNVAGAANFGDVAPFPTGPADSIPKFAGVSGIAAST